MVRKENFRTVALFVAFFLFLCFVMWCTPFTSDDFEFATMHFDGCEDFLSYVLYYGNGRVLGNIVSIGLCQLPALAVVVKALCITAIIFLVPALLEMRQTYGYLLSFIVLIGINPALFGEIYTWTCGFSNYLPPILCSLMILYAIKHIPDSAQPLSRTLIYLLVFVFGIASQLFVEHSTLIHIALAFLLTIKYHLDRREKARRNLSALWLLATVIGAVIMFVVPILFFREENRSVGYRSIHLGSIMELIYSCARNAMQLSNSYMGTVGIVTCLGAFLTARLTRDARTEKVNRYIETIQLTSVVFLLLSRVLSVDSWQGPFGTVYHGISAVFVVLPFAVWGFSAFFLEEKGRRNEILILLGLAILSLLVFLIVSPTPPRVVYQSYIFVVAAFLRCCQMAVLRIKEKELLCIQKIIAITVCILILLLSITFFDIRGMVKIREDHILQQIEDGATTIEIFEIPYEYVFWDSEWGFYHYYYREEPKDIQYVTFTFDAWRYKYLKESE